MKVYTVAVYNLRIFMKEDNPGPNYFSREIISSAGPGGINWSFDPQF